MIHLQLQSMCVEFCNLDRMFGCQPVTNSLTTALHRQHARKNFFYLD